MSKASFPMNAPWHGRTRLDPAAEIVGARYGIVLPGLLPNGTVAHASEPNPLVFVAEKTREDLSLLEICSAEIALQDELGCAVRILLTSELSGPQGQAILSQSRPL